MDFVDLSYKNYLMLFKDIKKVVETDATPLGKKKFTEMWNNDKKFRKTWSNFIFFSIMKCPDCGADLALSTKGSVLELQHLKHN